MLLVSSLCEAYHWTLEEAFSLTVPQVLMLNHAAYVNHENVDRKVKAKHKKEGGGNYDYYQKPAEIERDPVVMAGKRMSELSSEEMEQYLSEGFM